MRRKEEVVRLLEEASAKGRRHSLALHLERAERAKRSC